jgi:hypothetical protein
MLTIWNWILSRDLATTRLLAIAALVLNHLGFCAARNPDNTSWELWVGAIVYVISDIAIIALIIAATSERVKRRQG